MRYVFDTNVIVAALRSDRGSSRHLLRYALTGRLLMLLSVPLVLEYESVLTRPEQGIATGLSIGETNALLDAVVRLAEPVWLRFLWRPRVKDPADEMVLETAVNGRADRLVTFNLVHLKAAAEEFGIRTMTPPEAWNEVRLNENE